jgi:hypothetical protein
MVLEGVNELGWSIVTAQLRAGQAIPSPVARPAREAGTYRGA